MLRRMNFVKNRDKIRSFIYVQWPRVLPYLVTRGWHDYSHKASKFILRSFHSTFHSRPVNVLNVAVNIFTTYSRTLAVKIPSPFPVLPAIVCLNEHTCHKRPQGKTSPPPLSPLWIP